MGTSFLSGEGFARPLWAAVSLLALGAHAQVITGKPDRILTTGNRRSQAQQRPIIRAEVDLVAVPVMVTDSQGKTVTGLETSAFAVFEQGARQHIVSLSTEDAPCSINIVFDTSGSMKSVATSARRSIRAFGDALHPGDEVSLTTVADRPQMQFDFTTELSRVESHTLFSAFAGSTALIDSVWSGIQHMRHASHARRVLLIVSDGRDNNSRFSKHELMQLALESDVQIYSIGVAEPPRTKREIAENQFGRYLLEDLAQATGGLHSVVWGPRDLEATAARYGRAMHDLYVITYYSPKRSDDGKWRKLEVKVTNPAGQQIRVSARRRYFVPGRQ